MGGKATIPISHLRSVCKLCLHSLRPSIGKTKHPQTSTFARTLSTSKSCPGIAAPPIDFSQDGLPGGLPPGVGLSGTSDELGNPEAAQPKSKFPRVVPASPSYFSGKPGFTDDLVSLRAVLRKYQTLPTLEPGQAPRVAWQTLPAYRVMVGEAVKAAKYHRILEVLKRMNMIHPALMPEEVKEAIARYKRNIDPFAVRRRPQIIDEYGRSFGNGRRKASTARVWLVEGEGEVLVNGRNINEAFPRIHDRESAIWALKATGRVDKYNVWALVQGGGLTGQAESITLGLAKALLVHEPALKPVLRRAGCITRDPRRVERKKPGHVKARKMPAWVKR